MEVGVLPLAIDASVLVAVPEPSELESVGFPESVLDAVLDGAAALDVAEDVEFLALF